MISSSSLLSETSRQCDQGPRLGAVAPLSKGLLLLVDGVAALGLINESAFAGVGPKSRHNQHANYHFAVFPEDIWVEEVNSAGGRQENES